MGCEKLKVRIKKILFLSMLTLIVLIMTFGIASSFTGINLANDVINGIVKKQEELFNVSNDERSKENVNESLQNYSNSNVTGSIENNRGKVTNFTEEEFVMFVAIIFCEAGAEEYEAKLGVANVVINRLYDSRYPNTLKDVLYQKSQFSPARDGLLDKRIAEYNNGKFTTNNHKECIQAAKEAMAGRNNIGTQIGFLTPKLLEEYFGGVYTDRIDIGKISFFNV